MPTCAAIVGHLYFPRSRISSSKTVFSRVQIRSQSVTNPRISSKIGKGYVSRSLCLILLRLPSALAATCYNPPTVAGQNGTVQSSQYTTCNVNQEVSMCCRQTQSGIYTADSCLPNGLCVNESADNVTTYWRESCTDPTWKSPYCVNALNACGMVS